jgi:hypothetical protein
MLVSKSTQDFLKEVRNAAKAHQNYTNATQIINICIYVLKLTTSWAEFDPRLIGTEAESVCNNLLEDVLPIFPVIYKYCRHNHKTRTVVFNMLTNVGNE